MWDFSIRQALDLMRQTAPFLIFRMMVYFGVTMAVILATGTGAGVGWTMGFFGDEAFQSASVVWGSFAGFGIAAGAIFFLRDYLLYLVKAGHIAVMIEIMENRVARSGRAQVEHAWEVVRERFGQASSLFGLDLLIRGVIRAVTGLVEGILMLIPIPGLDKVVWLLRSYLRLAVGLVDEVMIAHLIRTESQNPFRDAQAALVLYAQNGQAMLRNAAWLMAFVWILTLVIFLIMLVPAAFVVWLLPGTWSAGGFLFAVVFAWAVKAALIEPFAVACMMQVFFRLTEGQVPDPEWTGRLDSASGKFRALGERAKTWAGGGSARQARREEMA